MVLGMISAGWLNGMPANLCSGGEMPQRRIRKYTRSATRVLLIVAAIVISFILLMLFAIGW